VRPTTALETAYRAGLVFEAVTENKDLKVKILKQIDENNPNKPWYFTNTSSVPIHLIESEAGLKGRVLGFHFYNPPAVQKLVELIVTHNSEPEMKQFALDYATALRKVVVPSNDIAGFIGNGHFMRDALYGINQALELAKNRPFHEAVYMINKVSQEFLVRPMGIFQLIDYVGIDVVQFIMKVMNPHMKDENLHSPLLDQLLELNVKGGQQSSGAQKDGFLKYQKGAITAVYEINKQTYIAVDEFATSCDQELGELPAAHKPWKAAVRIANKDSHFVPYFEAMKSADNLGAKLAIKYGQNADAIGRKLVSDGVANQAEDVNTVMLTGFFHAFGPINNYFA